MRAFPRWLTTFMFCSAFLAIGYLALTYEPASSDTGGTVPPLAPFTKRASTEVTGPGATVGYEIIVANQVPTYTGVLVGVTDTLPIAFSVSGPVTASLGQATVVDSRTITWAGVIDYGQRVTITYRALVAADAVPITPTNVVITYTNLATLWEINHAGGAPPTEKLLTATADVQVQPWELNLPTIVHFPTPLPPPPLPVLPTDINGGFESGRDGKWHERNAGSPTKLIFRNGETITLIMPARNGHYFAWLGGEPDAANELAQEVSLPPGYSNMGLVFDYWIWSEEDSCSRDTAVVSVDGTTLNTFGLCKATITPVDPTNGGWRKATYALTNLPQTAARNVTIKFTGTTNGSKNSNFFIDNVYLCSNDLRAPEGTQRCP